MTVPPAPDHDPLVLQSTNTNASQWWVNCGTCDRIIGDWYPTREAADAFADWHATGEHGPAPVSAQPVPLPAAPVQLDLFATA